MLPNQGGSTYQNHFGNLATFQLWYVWAKEWGNIIPNFFVSGDETQDTFPCENRPKRECRAFSCELVEKSASE
jgi:hypothetical protein